ncbi:MAG: hypothetical protein ABJE10_24355 [bacterium]
MRRIYEMVDDSALCRISFNRSASRLVRLQLDLFDLLTGQALHHLALLRREHDAHRLSFRHLRVLSEYDADPLPPETAAPGSTL